MNREIYTKNIESIRLKYPNWAKMIESESYELNDEVRVSIDESIEGSTIFRVSNAGKTLYLNGKYNPAYAGKDWLESVGKIEDFATVVIVGIHDGIHIRNILKEVNKKTSILIYEPSIEIFINAIREVDLSFLFEENVPIGIIVEGINGEEKKPYFGKMINYDNMMMLKVYLSRNYEKLFQEKVEDFVNRLRKHVFHIEKNWNTAVCFTSVNAKNVFHNCKYMYDGYSVLSLLHILTPDVPTIVVSAGPSLNKNMLDLKNAVGKANIIATDTAMKPLLNAGIIPNFFVVVDGLKPGILFEHKDISKVPIVTMNAISDEPMRIHKGKKFYYVGDSGLEHEIMKRAKARDNKTVLMPGLSCGGSVAHMAYSLGIFMGSKTIILIGQDLAMTNNRTHADGTFQDKMEEIDVNSGQYFEVESIDGGKVLTRNDFYNYIKWYEDQIRTQSEIRVIDATEGGAKIHGTEIMTLKEAIEETCTKEFNVSYKVSRCPKMLSEVGREEMLKVLEEVPERLAEVEKKAIEGIKRYEKLMKFSKKKLYSEKELNKLLKQIGKINHFMETDYMASVVTDSLRGVEMTLRASIYQSKDEKSDEMYDIAQNGVFMLQSIQYASKELIELAEKTVVPFAKKQREKIAKKAGK